LWDHQLGDLIYSPNGVEVRDAIRQADCQFIPQAKHVFANSANVAARLKYFCDIEATPLYHPPPGAEEFYTSEAEDYLFFPSRLCLPKRQSLVLEALAHTRQSVRVCFAGAADQPAYQNELKSLARKLRVHNRVEWLGEIGEPEKRELYARALAVVYPPIDEDFGYVTLEAMLASKPLIVCTDSGGPLEFLHHEETGLIAEPQAAGLAKAFDRLWQDRTAAKRWGMAGRTLYAELDITWANVVRRLLS
jgi:glycosyltransferase involved in cell wall biosynthesis